MPAPIREGVDAVVWFRTDADQAVPPFIGRHSFKARGRLVDFAVLAPDTQRAAVEAIRARAQALGLALKKEADGKPKRPLSNYGEALRYFIEAAGGRVRDDGTIDADGIGNNGDFRLQAFAFRSKGYTVVAILPRPLTDVARRQVGGVFKRDYSVLEGIWAKTPIWIQDEAPKKEELVAKVKALLPTGNRAYTQREIDRIYRSLPSGRYAMTFFLPTYYRGKSVDAYEEVNRLGATLGVATLFVQVAAEDLAQLPAMKEQLRSANELITSLKRTVEVQAGTIASLSVEGQEKDQDLIAKGKPVRYPSPVSMPPGLGPPWGPQGGSEEAGWPQGPKRRLNLRLKVVAPALSLLAGLALAAYGAFNGVPSTLPAQQAQVLASQEAIAAAVGAMLTVGSIAALILLNRKGKTIKPGDLTQAQGQAQPQAGG